MKQRTLYQVRVTQEIPFCDYDEDGEETQVSSGRIEEYVAGRFSAEHNAKLFAEALENKITEGSGYVHIPQELRIRSRGTERHSASN